MNVNKNMTIGGIPIKKVRDFLRKVRTPYSFNLNTLSNYFSISDQIAYELLRELLIQGYIRNRDGDRYEVSVKGNALAIKRFVPRINKTKADKIFNEFMERVKEVNTNDDYIYRVKKLILFGSYLDSSAEDYGDIDIVYELEPKISDSKALEDAEEKIVNDAMKNGRQFRNFVDQLFYPETLVIRYLRNRNCYISLHDKSDEIFKTTLHKQIFP